MATTAGPTELPDSNLLGPSTHEFWHNCWAMEPLAYGFVWATAPVLAIVASFISFQHNRALRKVPVTGFRQRYLRCSGLPLLYALGNLFLIMTTPRSSQMVNVLLTQYEAYVLSGFGDLLFQLLALESASVQTATQDPISLARGPTSLCTLDESAPATIASTKHLDASHRVLEALALQGPRKHFSQVPFCCVGCFMQPHDLSSGQLLACFFLLQQFIIVNPVLALATLWFALAQPNQFSSMNYILNGVGHITKVLAFYGLFVLWNATGELLMERWQTTKKFVSLKTVVVIGTVQSPIVGIIVTHLDDGPKCLTDAPMIEFWNAYLLMIWSVILAILIKQAFPSHEVMSNDDELYFPGNFELDLRRHYQRTRAAASEIRTPRPSGAHMPLVDETL